jgi:hypothetical protein
MPGGNHRAAPTEIAMNTDRIRCTETREKLPLFVGGDLDPDVLATVRAHLEGCPECAARAGAAERGRRALVDALLERCDEGTQPELWAGIRATLASEGRIQGSEPFVGRPRALPAGPRRWTRRVLAPLAAAAAILLGVPAVFMTGEEVPGKRLAPVGAPVVQVPTFPVSNPVVDGEVLRGGALENVPAEEASRVRRMVPFRRPGLERQAPGDSSISLTGYR